jgi:hypothetical protein
MRGNSKAPADRVAERIVRHPDGSIDVAFYLERGRNRRSGEACRIAAVLLGGWTWRYPFSRRTLPAR